MTAGNIVDFDSPKSVTAICVASTSIGPPGTVAGFGKDCCGPMVAPEASWPTPIARVSRTLRERLKPQSLARVKRTELPRRPDDA
jgi:hypothetical protein